MKIPVWSYSFLNVYDRCPKQAAAMYVERNYPKDAVNEAMDWGNVVHSAMEVRINDGVPLPTNMLDYEKYVHHIEAVASDFGANELTAEVKLGVTKDYKPCDFFDKERVWGRGKLDLVLRAGNSAILPDWKTGKPREDPMELKVNAVLLQAWYPEITDIFGMYVWLKEDRIGEPHDLSDTASTREWINETMRKAEASNFWVPKRNALCGWCNLTACPNWRERK